jgi:hypothetical protein
MRMFRQSLEINQPMIDGVMVFATSCIRNRCPAFVKSKGDFRVVRLRASKVYEALGVKRVWWEVENVIPNVYYLLGCRICAERISTTFAMAAEANKAVFYMRDSI